MTHLVGALEGAHKAWLPQRLDDGLLEVVGIRSTVHMGQIQLGLSKAVPIAQVSTASTDARLSCLPEWAIFVVLSESALLTLI